MTAVLFDLDGTLLDTLDDLTASVNAALAAFSLPPRTREEVRKFLGNGAERLIRLSLPGEKTDPPAEEVLKTFREHYNAHCLDRTRPYDGILEALGVLPMPVAIVSNKPDSAVKPLCARFFPGIPAFGETADCPRKPARSSTSYVSTSHANTTRRIPSANVTAVRTLSAPRSASPSIIRP